MGSESWTSYRAAGIPRVSFPRCLSPETGTTHHCCHGPCRPEQPQDPSRLKGKRNRPTSQWESVRTCSGMPCVNHSQLWGAGTWRRGQWLVLFRPNLSCMRTVCSVGDRDVIRSKRGGPGLWLTVPGWAVLCCVSCTESSALGTAQ